MLQSSSHLSRVCGQSHYKKFWLMQTQMDKQDNCCVGSPSTRSVPATVIKGPESKPAAPLCSGNSPPAKNFVVEAAPQAGRPSWSVTGAGSNGSNSAGSVGVLSGNGTLVSLTTCAQSLSPFRPEIVSDRLSRIPFVDCGYTDCMDMRDTQRDVEAEREVSNLSASFSPCISPSCLTLSFPDYGAHEGILHGCGTEIVRQSDTARIRDATPLSTQSVRAFLAPSVQEASQDDSSSIGWESLDLSAQKKTFTSGDKLPSFPSSSTEVEADTKFHSREGVLSYDRNSRDACIESTQSGLYGTHIAVQKLSQHSSIVEKGELLTSEALTPIVGRNSLRTCKFCGTTKTPLWRSGPLGPKSLCNACGIRFKKSRRCQAADEGLHLEPATPTSSKSCARSLKRKLCKDAEGEIVRGARSLKRSRWSTAMVFKRDCVFKGEDSDSCLTSPETASSKLQVSNMLSSSCSRQSDFVAQLASLGKQSRLTKVFAKDVEEAAFLLMALSCGLVLA